MKSCRFMILLMLLTFVLCVSALAGCSSTEVVEYEIVEISDVSFATTVRFAYKVVVPGDPTEGELQAVIEEVVEQAKDGQAFNALSIGLYGNVDDDLPTLGIAELAPGGEWGAADTVDPGDYKEMDLVVDFSGF